MRLLLLLVCAIVSGLGIKINVIHAASAAGGSKVHSNAADVAEQKNKARGIPFPLHQCPGWRSDLAFCMLELTDLDDDGFMSIEEIDIFLAAQHNFTTSCLPTNEQFYTFVNGFQIVTACDREDDGLLGIDDFENPTACLLSYNARRIACQICYGCGWRGPDKKRQAKVKIPRGTGVRRTTHSTTTTAITKVHTKPPHPTAGPAR